MINLSHLRFEYEPSFRLLIEDFEEFLAFVEPVDSNLGTYSHRSYELFLRACTEFESLSKQALICKGSTKQPKDMNINDYRQLDPCLGLDLTEVAFLTWRPQPAYIRPYQGWTTTSPPLGWYSDYNKVKHNRNTEFHRTSLNNLRHAIAAVFLLHIKTYLPELVGITQRTKIESGIKENTICTFPYSIFSVRCPA